MRRIRSELNRVNSFLLLIIMAFSIVSCGENKEKNEIVSLDDLIATGNRYSGTYLEVEGCLKPNPHGLAVRKCASDGIGVTLLFTEQAQREFGAQLFNAALKSDIEKRPLIVRLCGIFSQADNGRDRWIEVDSFSMEDRIHGDMQACQ